MSWFQRSVACLMLATIAVALGIGFWPVTVDVTGDATYSCGSGFVHSGHQWTVDSRSLDQERTGDSLAVGPPTRLCPPLVYDRRDWALLIGSFAIVVGAVLIALTQRQQDPRSRATLATLRARRR